METQLLMRRSKKRPTTRVTKLIAAAALAGVAFTATPANAQSLPEKVWNDLRWAAGDAFFLVTSPVRGSASDWRTAGWVTAAT
ncbi:MAG: hypothetical protein ACRELX_17075, partial [Longimicrobiales bacterium]